MIATILPSSTSFHAVEYNEKKVAKGQAQLLEICNFGFIGQIEPYTSEDLKSYLIKYTEERNRRIKYPQFHVAISCKGNEYSEEQLVRIAHDYLREMGYDNAGQPVLIYGHRDTDNNHIHIITSRIAPDGHKIDHNHEKRRSLKAINKIMQVDDDQKLSNLISNAKRYYFTTSQQYMAVFETSGYECYEEDGRIHLKRGGMVKLSIEVPRIEQGKQKPDVYERRKRMIKTVLSKYHEMSSNKEELAELMKNKFNICLKFLGSKDHPYGYMVVDHGQGIVYKGSEIIKLKSLLDFEKPADRFKRIGEYVGKIVETNDGLTTRELNKMLRRQFGQIMSRDGHISWNDNDFQVPVHILDLLKKNDRAAWLQSFHPSTETERAILCKLGSGCNPDKIVLESSELKKVEHTIGHLRFIMESDSDEPLAIRLFRNGLLAYHVRGKYYCLDIRHKTIFCLDDYGIKTNEFKSMMIDDANHENEGLKRGKEKNNPIVLGGSAQQAISGISKVLRLKVGSNNGNREWEVGKHSNYDDIDDERGLKR